MGDLTVAQLLLNYLPLEKSLWKDVLKTNRDLYKSFAEELTIDPRKNEHMDDHVNTLAKH
jgi:hypothetical protein